MVKRLFCFILLCLFIFLFSSPAFALNTVGFVQQDMSLVGASFYSTQYTTGLAVMYPSSSDDSISKFFNASSVDITDGYFYIFWRAPPVYEYSISCSFNFAGDLDIQSSDIMLGAYRESAGFYAFPVSYDVDVISMPGVYQGLTSYTVNFSVDTTSLDYIYDYCCLCVHTGSNAYFSPGVSFASSGSSLSLTPGSSTSSVSLSGRVGFRSISSNYTYNYSSLPSNFGNALLKVVPLSDSSGYNGQSGVFFRTVSVLADVFGGASSSSVDADAVIRTASSGTVSNPTYSGSSSISSISASSNSFVLLSDTGSFYYGDDDGLVDTVKNIDGTLTDMAGNLQTITDDFTAKKETAEDIGGVVSDTDISDNDATLSTGMDSLDQGIDSLNISDVSAPALSFSSFMTANAVALLNFGNGVLYWALFALVILSVLLFIFRRLF